MFKMLKIEKKEQAVEHMGTTKQEETQLGVTSFNKIPRCTTSSVGTEEEGKRQEDTVNPMGPMEEHHKGKGSLEQVKGGQTSILIAK